MNFIAFCLLLTLIDVSLTNELKFEDKIYPNLTKADGRYKSMDCTNKYGDFCDSDCSTLLVNVSIDFLLNKKQKRIFSDMSWSQTANCREKLCFNQFGSTIL